MSGKRTLSISVRMSTEDMKLFQNAADVIWPKAPLTRSSIVLGLARIVSETVLKDHKSGKA